MRYAVGPSEIEISTTAGPRVENTTLKLKISMRPGHRASYTVGRGLPTREKKL
jgi:hypothetical protein